MTRVLPLLLPLVFAISLFHPLLLERPAAGPPCAWYLTPATPSPPLEAGPNSSGAPDAAVGSSNVAPIDPRGGRLDVSAGTNRLSDTGLPASPPAAFHPFRVAPYSSITDTPEYSSAGEMYFKF